MYHVADCRSIFVILCRMKMVCSSFFGSLPVSQSGLLRILIHVHNQELIVVDFDHIA